MQNGSLSHNRICGITKHNSISNDRIALQEKVVYADHGADHVPRSYIHCAYIQIFNHHAHPKMGSGYLLHFLCYGSLVRGELCSCVNPHHSLVEQVVQLVEGQLGLYAATDEVVP